MATTLQHERSAPVRRLRRPGRPDPNNRKAVYVEDSDVTMRRESSRDEQNNSDTVNKRLGVHLDVNVTERTPLLNDVENVITAMSRDQQRSADNMASRSESLQNETNEAFQKVTTKQGRKAGIWILCCGCCCCFKDTDR